MTSTPASTTGQLLDSAFAAYRRHVAVLAGTVAVALAPTVLMEIAGGPFRHLSALFGLYGAVVAIVQSSDALGGRRPAILGALGVGARRFLPALLTMVFLVIVITAATLPFAAVAVLTRPGLSGLTGATFVGTVVVLAVLWAIVVSWLSLRYFALLQVAVLEPGAVPSDRSAALARGAYGRIALVWLIGLVVIAVPSALAGAGQGAATVLHARGAAPGWVVPVAAVLAWIVNSLCSPFCALLGTALYLDRCGQTTRGVTASEVGLADRPAAPLVTEPAR